jgi:DNA (cytosine-5)-methyltransferase 1
VIGIDADANALRRYPFDHACLDWREGLERYAGCVDLIHASPPCQRYSRATRNDNKPKHPDLIGPVRDALAATGTPYVIENVPRAPLRDPIILCGCMFSLGAEYQGVTFGLYRPRLFEATLPLSQPSHVPHVNPAMPVFGHNTGGHFRKRYGLGIPSAIRSQAMGTEWMNRSGTSESIPPVFTEYIGTLAIGHTRTRAQFDLAA